MEDAKFLSYLLIGSWDLKNGIRQDNQIYMRFSDPGLKLIINYIIFRNYGIVFRRLCQ